MISDSWIMSWYPLTNLNEEIIFVCCGTVIFFKSLSVTRKEFRHLIEKCMNIYIYFFNFWEMPLKNSAVFYFHNHMGILCGIFLGLWCLVGVFWSVLLLQSIKFTVCLRFCFFEHFSEIGYEVWMSLSSKIKGPLLSGACLHQRLIGDTKEKNKHPQVTHTVFTLNL